MSNLTNTNRSTLTIHTYMQPEDVVYEPEDNPPSVTTLLLEVVKTQKHIIKKLDNIKTKSTGHWLIVSMNAKRSLRACTRPRLYETILKDSLGELYWQNLPWSESQPSSRKSNSSGKVKPHGTNSEVKWRISVEMGSKNTYDVYHFFKRVFWAK